MWVFEGMDGAGKSTQARRLADALLAAGGAPLHLREPGSTPWGERLRALLLDPVREPVAPRAEALLFFAARVELLRCEVAPALAAGHDVVCERFTPSTLAYQGQAEEDSALILELDRMLVPDELQPDAVFLLDLEPEASFARVQAAAGEHGAGAAGGAGDARGGSDATGGGLDSFEQRGVDFQRRVREGYLRYAAARPERSVVLDGSLSEDELAAAVLAETERRRR